MGITSSSFSEIFIPLVNSNRGSILFKISQSETQPMELAEMDKRIDPLIELIRGIKLIKIDLLIQILLEHPQQHRLK